jgi:organic hydroperoxide reductase OsmC/OhrA
MERRSEDEIYQYRSRTTWRSARQGVLSASQRPDIVVGSPPGAVNSCIMLTFLTLATARGVDLVGYESDVDGTLEKVSGVYQMTKITVRPRVVVASEGERAAALRAMDHVEAHCFMSQSVKATVALIPEITAATSPQ